MLRLLLWRLARATVARAMGVVSPERERAAPPERPPEPAPRRQVPWGLLTIGALVAALVLVPGWLLGLLPSSPNPFAEKTVDRSQPALLRSIRDLREFRAASGRARIVVLPPGATDPNAGCN